MVYKTLNLRKPEFLNQSLSHNVVALKQGHLVASQFIPILGEGAYSIAGPRF